MHDSSLHKSIRSQSLGQLWRALRIPIVMISLFVIPPMMGPDDYGKYAVFISIMIIWDTVARIGTTQIFGRFIPEYGDDEKSKRTYLLHGIMYYEVLLCVAVFAVGYVLFRKSGGIEGFDAAWLPVMFAVLILSKIDGTVFGFLYGLNRIGQFSAKEPIRSACTLVLVVVLYLKFGLIGAFWGLVANEVIVIALGSWWSREYLFARPARVRLADFKPFLLFGVAFYIPSFLFGLLQRSGVLLVAELRLSTSEVALYEIANQFFLLTGMFLRQSMAALVPSLASFHIADDQDTVRKWQRMALVLCGVVVFLAYHALMLFGQDVLSVWLGAGGEAARGRWLDSDAMTIHGNASIMALALLPLLVAQAGLNFSILDKKPKIYAWAVMLGLVTLFVSCVILVPEYGSRGAAWATLHGYSVMALVFMVRYGLRLLRTLTGFACVILLGMCFVPLYKIDMGFTASVSTFAVSGIVYVILLFVFRIVKVDEAKQLVLAFKKRKA